MASAAAAVGPVLGLPASKVRSHADFACTCRHKHSLSCLSACMLKYKTQLAQLCSSNLSCLPAYPLPMCVHARVCIYTYTYTHSRVSVGACA